MSEFDTKSKVNTQDLLVTNNVHCVERGETILSGEVVARGMVMGKITATGKLVEVDDTLANGAQNPYGVMANDVDATAGDKVGPVFIKGEFLEEKLTFGDNDTIDDHRVAMRDLGMLTKSIEEESP